jgi:micrococcal nuclease
MARLDALNTAQVYLLYQQLEEARAGRGAERGRLADERTALELRARAEPEVLALLARQILLLNRHDRLLAAEERLATLQMRLLQRLVYAREEESLARQLEAAASRGGFDWLDAITWASGLRRSYKKRALWLREVMAYVEDLVTPEPVLVPGLKSEWVTVLRVMDGDGAVLEDGRRVRYIGIDAPELRRRHPEPYAEEARDLNHALVAGKRLRLERDESEVDVHGRLLRYVWVGRRLVNAELVRRGAAFAFPVPPDRRFRDQLARLEREARRDRRGLWAKGWE